MRVEQAQQLERQLGEKCDLVRSREEECIRVKEELVRAQQEAGDLQKQLHALEQG